MLKPQPPVAPIWFDQALAGATAPVLESVIYSVSDGLFRGAVFSGGLYFRVLPGFR